MTMSAQTVESILSRAMSDASFAEALLANPEQALAGFDLTAEELANVKGMSRADFNEFAAASPEVRKSMGNNWNHNETMLTIR
jgi:acetyl-CoA acetyltransferase